MRPGEFWEALAAYNEAKSADRIHIGELVRGATLRLFNLQVDKRYRKTDPRKYWPLPWDERQAGSEQEEILRLARLTPEQTQNEVQKFFERLNHGKRVAES